MKNSSQVATHRTNHVAFRRDRLNGESTELRPQQRLPRVVVARHVWVVINEGVLSIDVMPTASQRQILDFLMPGDLLTLTPMLAARAVSLRAITPAKLDYVGQGNGIQADDLDKEDRIFVLDQQFAQLARANMHQLMIGHLEVEERVASGLLFLALRCGSVKRTDFTLPLPMSRDDLADYLIMNRDTLSRIMMRFESLGLIERLNRHALRVADLLALERLSPISGLIAAACTSAFPEPVNGT